MLTLLLGGARSGKSALAVELGHRHADAGGTVAFVATCAPFDDDLAERVARHRAERPPWPTIEEPCDLGAALGRAGEALAIVDCLTLWVSNLVHRGDGDAQIEALAEKAAQAAAARSAPTVAVSNEVGWGIHPENALARRFRDVAGRVNRIWADESDTTLLVVAGRAVRLEDPWTRL